MSLKKIKQSLLHDIQRLKSPDGYLNAGHPRYNTLFGRDSLISSWQMLKIEPSVARASINALAFYQGKKIDPLSEEEPGKILHEHRKTSEERNELPHWKFPYYGSADSTSLFIVVATEYFRLTGDKSFIVEILENLLAAFEWMKTFGDKDEDGYIEYNRRNPQGLFHQGWKDGDVDHLKIDPPVAIIEVQGYAYLAYLDIAFLAKRFMKKNISEEALRRAQSLKKSLNRDFWMRDEGFFALALDRRKEQRKAVTSNPGHLLFTGIVSEEKTKPLVSRLFQPDLWTPYGIRNHSVKDSDFDPYSYHTGSVWPHDNWIIYKGLKSLGFTFHAEKIKNALFRAFFKLGKIPEFYTFVEDLVDLSDRSAKKVPSNPLQAWSSAGLLDMIWNSQHCTDRFGESQ